LRDASELVYENPDALAPDVTEDLLSRLNTSPPARIQKRVRELLSSDSTAAEKLGEIHELLVDSAVQPATAPPEVEPVDRDEIRLVCWLAVRQTESWGMQERLDFAFRALDDALKRAASADVDDRFGPLAESLLWVVILNDTFWDDNESAYRRSRSSDPDGRIIEGLRYARHRLVHDIRVYGLHGVIYYGGAFDQSFSSDFDIGTPKWEWREISLLAPAEKTEGEDIYQESLQGEDVEESLNKAANFLRRYRSGWMPAG
jgi:hypothetical protein